MDQEARLRKGKDPDSSQSMHGYILTYSRLLKGDPLTALGSQQKGPFLRPQYSIAGEHAIEK